MNEIKELRTEFKRYLTEKSSINSKIISQSIIKYIKSISYQDGYNAGYQLITELTDALHELSKHIPRDTMAELKHGILDNIKQFNSNTKNIG